VKYTDEYNRPRIEPNRAWVKRKHGPYQESLDGTKLWYSPEHWADYYRSDGPDDELGGADVDDADQFRNYVYYNMNNEAISPAEYWARVADVNSDGSFIANLVFEW